jgi:hypothetical protein
LESQFGILTTDVHLTISSFDHWMEKTTSRSFTDVRGKKLTDLFPEIEKRGLIAPLRRVLEQGVVELLSPALHGYFIACPPSEPTGRFQHMQQRTVVAPLRNDAEIIGLIITIEDVTFRRDEDRTALADLGSGDWRARRGAVERILEEPGESVVTELISRLRREHRHPGLLNSVLPMLASGTWQTLEPDVLFRSPTSLISSSRSGKNTEAQATKSSQS